MAKSAKAKAVLVGLGMAAATLFGAMAPAHADELGGTGIVGSYTTPETKTVSGGLTAFDGIYTVHELAHLTLASGGKHYPDATLITRSATVDAATATGL